MSADRFLRLPKTHVRAGVSSGPVLIRVVYTKQVMPGQPGWQEAAHRDLLQTYPANVLYGGPTQAEFLNTPMGQAFLSSLGTWMFSHGFTSDTEIVPIAAEAHGHTWPHREWRWWYTTEHQPRETYKLAVWRIDSRGNAVPHWVLT
jgi:hypothetical protein